MSRGRICMLIAVALFLFWATVAVLLGRQLG